jgi:hypothetical protein
LLAPQLELLESRVYAEDLPKSCGIQNRMRRGERIWSGRAGAAGVPCDITVR